MPRWPALVAAVAAVVLVALSLLVAADAPLLAAVDGPPERAARAARTPGSTAAAAAATWLGSAWVLAPLTLVVAAVARARAGTWRPGAAVALAGGGAYASTEVLKRVLERPRPADRLVDAAGWSFPSGHSTDAAAWWLTAAAVAIWAAGARWPRWRRGSAWAAGALVAVVVGATRVFLGVHHPTDVLAGWALGLLWAWLVVAASGVLPAPAHGTAAGAGPRR